MSKPPSIDYARSRYLFASLCHAFFIAVFTCFLLRAIDLALANGVCCADDGSFASLSKNLAFGYGYLSTIAYNSSSYSGLMFNATVQTTGPTVILPAAGFIRLFGNQYWVPGLALICIWMTLIFSIYKILCYVASPPRVSAAIAAFLITVYAVSTWHFEQWWALLGEVPAILFAILGICLWAVNPDNKRCLAISSLIIGLAVTTKLLSLIYVGAFVLVVLIRRLLNASDIKIKSAFTESCFASIFCMLPFACFEMWKLFVLGFSGYVQNIRQLIAFSHNKGFRANSSLISQISEHSHKFYEHFGFSLWLVLLLIGTSFLFSYHTRNGWFRRFVAVGAVAILIHTLYWLILSLGWPRYIYMEVVLICFMMALPLLIIERASVCSIYVLLMALSLNKALGGINFSTIFPSGEWSVASSDRQNQAKTVEFLNAHLARRPFIAQRGAWVTDLEYLSKTVGNFTGYKALKPENFKTGFLVVSNVKFDHNRKVEDPGFLELVSKCGEPVLVAQPYKVYDCRPQDN